VREAPTWARNTEFSEEIILQANEVKDVDLMSMLDKTARNIILRSSVDNVLAEINADEKWATDNYLNKRAIKLFTASPIVLGSQRARMIRLTNNSGTTATIRIYATTRNEEFKVV